MSQRICALLLLSLTVGCTAHTAAVPGALADAGAVEVHGAEVAPPDGDAIEAAGADVQDADTAINDAGCADDCKPPCPADKPVWLAAASTCVECETTQQCGGGSEGPYCNLDTHTCYEDNAPACFNCEGSLYPWCIEVNGTYSCVECGSDKMCNLKNKGTCNLANHQCSGTCGSDGSCPSDTAFDLACDATTVTCFDQQGRCDDVSAFCRAAMGSLCVAGVGRCSCAPVEGQPVPSDPAACLAAQKDAAPSALCFGLPCVPDCVGGSGWLCGKP